MALRPVDRLLATYLGFVTIVILLRGSIVASGTVWLLVMHALFVVLLMACSRLETGHRLGTLLYDVYPLVLLLPLYGEIGVLGAQAGRSEVLRHDLLVQGWETALFGSQVSYEWIRRAPSVFWSGLFHLAYLWYYPLILIGPLALLARGRRPAAQRVLFATMLAYMSCYIVFVLFPVAGPYYAFPHPRGAVREVWSAELVYGLLQDGSSFGAAFPSSHVAATAAAVLATVINWRALGFLLIVPCVLLMLGTVYCQMHYGVDVLAGLVTGIGAGLLQRRGQPEGLLE